MHCYQTFAAATVIANTFELVPDIGRKLPYAVIVDWMEQHGIEPADVLYAAPDAVKARLLFEIQQGRPRIPHAA